MGWTLNEYALTTIKSGRSIAGKTEEEIYAKLKLPYIEPELREMRGEIEAAEQSKLPSLIKLEDMRGDVQMHSTASDGRNTVEEMGEAARALGYEFIAITEHSQADRVPHGMDEKRTLENIRRIRAAQEQVPGIRLLAGIEVDILKNGKLDLDNEVLAQLDVVVAIHSYMNLDRMEMTERLLAGIENPYTQIIAHPPVGYFCAAILCLRHGKNPRCSKSIPSRWNATYPDRLDLNDVHLRMAKGAV
jgi:DNA polymerase (family 10)